MAGYNEDWKNELLAKSDIVDVISSFLPLKRKGDNYWAPCPWHGETNPSFSVSGKKQMFYCFSCKKGGGVVNFIMEMERFSYPEALAWLAERAGMAMPEVKDDAAYKQKREYKKRLHALMRDAAIFYVNKLNGDEGSKAREYVENRGVSRVAKRFGIGYAPNSFNETSEYLKSLGYTVKELMDSAMVRSKDGHVYDTFRDRLMFPIQNVAGDVIAFGGRIMGEGEPKYLNSPESAIFNKRQNLYALNLIKRQRGITDLLLVEGYMDVVALAGGGVSGAVASLGTSLTKEQARLLKRFADKVYLCYDGDDAGKNASVRAGEILAAEDLNVHVMELPQGLDPDDVIKKWGAAWFDEKKKQGKQPMEFTLKQLARNFDMKDKGQVSKYATQAVALISKLDNEIEKDRYIKLLASATGISSDTLTRQLGKNAVKTYNIPTKEINLKKQDATEETALIATLLAYPDCFNRISGVLEAEDFTDENCAKIFSYINRRVKEGILPASAELIEVFSGNDSENGADIGVIMAQSPPEGTADMSEYALNIAKAVKRQNIKAQIANLMANMGKINEDARRQTLEKIASLQKQVRDI